MKPLFDHPRTQLAVPFLRLCLAVSSVVLLGVSQAGWAQGAANSAASGETNLAHSATTYEYAVGSIHNEQHQQEVKVVYDKEVIPDFNYEFSPPQILSIKLYSDDGKLLEEIKPESANSNASPVWPELTDLNFDGYPDLSLVISSGTLGDFYAYWLYDPKTGLFEEAIFDGGEPVNSFADAKHQQIISSVATRWAYETNVSISRWDGLHLKEEEYGSGYILPVQKDGQMHYCEVVVTYNQVQGTIDDSVKIEKAANGRIQLHGELPPFDFDKVSYEACYDETDMSSFPIGAIGVALWQKQKAGLVRQNPPMAVQWAQSKDAQGQLMEEWCPVIPYVDLDKHLVSTKTLKDDLDSGLSVCQDKEPKGK